ncbi:MAG: T9SS type A sorting domain-containing protein [Bacteroidota bacterium]
MIGKTFLLMLLASPVYLLAQPRIFSLPTDDGHIIIQPDQNYQQLGIQIRDDHGQVVFDQDEVRPEEGETLIHLFERLSEGSSIAISLDGEHHLFHPIVGEGPIRWEEAYAIITPLFTFDIIHPVVGVENFLSGEIYSNREGVVNLEVWDIQQNKPISVIQKVEVGNNEFSLNLSGLNAGVYILKLQLEGYQATQKFIKK